MTKELIEKQAELIHHLKHIITELYGSCNDSLTNKLESELSLLQGEDNDFPEIDFREQIANELTRDELIERLCEMHKSYTVMREEWFNKVHLGGVKAEEKTAEDFLIKQGYKKTIRNEKNVEIEPTFQWITVARLLTEFASQHRDIANCNNCNKWHRFRLSDNGDCSATKGVTDHKYYCAKHKFNQKGE